MDYLFTKNKNEDGDIFGPKFPNLPTDSDIMDTNWSTNPDDILDSIFSMDNDFLNNFDNTQEFESLEDLSARIKMEAEVYETTSATPYCNVTVADPKLENISSTSSDSGLSSDNLDIEMSPTYQPLSPAFSSPGPSISERGAKSDISSPDNTDHIKKHEDMTKVVVQRVPQVLTISAKNQVKQKLNVSNNKEIKIVKLSPHMFNTSNNKTVTIQVKNSNSGAKFQANPGTLFLNNGKVTEVKKLGKVQNCLNSRSILIPVSLKDVKDMKSIKFLNSTTFKKIVSNTTNPTTIKANEKFDDTLDENSSDNESIIIEDEYDFNDNNFEQQVHYTQGKKYPKLILTQEERRLLSKEGITLPSHYPLTKNEERELKRIRRKIRNKISAQDSRKRKKEYVDGLEERVKQCTEENQTLLKRIKLLQNQNQNLATQMKKLQSLITKGTNKTAQPTTCLMVLLLSLALVAAPNLKLGKNIQETELEDVVEESILQNRRNLLFDAKDQNSEIIDEINMSDIFGLSNLCEPASNSADICTKNKITEFNNCEPSCKKLKHRNDFIDFDVDEQNWYKTKKEDEEKTSIISNAFNSLAKAFKKNMKTSQTSGFNIGNNNDLLDQDVLDMISPKTNGIYGLNLDKIASFSNSDNDGINILVNSPYQNENDKKLNFSETQKF